MYVCMYLFFQQILSSYFLGSMLSMEGALKLNKMYPPTLKELKIMWKLPLSNMQINEK